MNKAKYLRIGFLAALTVFFLYRHLTQGGIPYLIITALYGLVAALLWARVVTTRQGGLAINIGIALVFLDLVFYRIDLKDMLAAVGKADYLMLIPATVLLAISFIPRAWRWRWLLYQTKKAGFLNLLSAFVIGTAGNMVLPARAGEFIRAYLLGRKEHISKTTVFATVVVERIFDGLTVLLFLLSVIILIGFRSLEIKYIGLAGAAFYLAAIISLLVLHFKSNLFYRLIEALLPEEIAHKAIGLLESFLEGLSVVKNTRQLIMVALLSLIGWVFIALSVWPVLRAFDFGAPVPLYTPFLLIGILGLGMMIPTPGGIGPFQYGCLLGLRIVFTPLAGGLVADFDERVVAFSLVLHLSQIVPEVLAGLLFYLREGIQLEEVETSL